MERMPQYLSYEGIDLLSIDFSGLNSDEMRVLIEISKSFVSKCKPGSILFFVKVTGIKYTVKSIRDFTNFSKYNRDFAKATAIIGISREAQVLYNVALSLAGRDKSTIKFFDEGRDDEARMWLKSVIDNEKLKQDMEVPD